MKISDFVIHSTDKLDMLLSKCCEQVLEKQKEDKDYWGMVGACVLDTSNRLVFGVNHLLDDGTRSHAERSAIDNYNEKYGSIPQGSIILTTLSPCSEPLAERHGESCTELINYNGVHKVYCGYCDPQQADSEVYKHKKFHVQETRNEKLKELCKKFASTFLDDTE